MLKLVKLLVGIMLLPTAAAVTMTFYGLISGHQSWGGLDQTTHWFMAGFIIWVILFLALPRPVHAYILGHELTHALWGLLMGARVSRLRVTEKGGSVTLSKSNIWITLSPYFFPFYSICSLVLYLLLSMKWDMALYRPFWYAVFGLTWSFHITFSIAMIGGHQPDIREHGRIFSYVLIYVINMLSAALLVVILAGLPWKEVPMLLGGDITSVYVSVWEWITPQFEVVIELLRNLVQ